MRSKSWLLISVGLALASTAIARQLVYVEPSYFVVDANENDSAGSSSKESNLYYSIEEPYFRLVVSYPQSLKENQYLNGTCVNRPCLEEYGATYYGWMSVVSRDGNLVECRVKKFRVEDANGHVYDPSYFQKDESMKSEQRLLHGGNLANSINKLKFSSKDMDSQLFYGLDLKGAPKNLKLSFEVEVFQPVSFDSKSISDVVYLSKVEGERRL